MQTPSDLRLIHLEGSPREMGRRHGLLLAREIRQMRRALLRYLVKAGLLIGALPLAALLYVLGGRFWSRIPIALQEEMRGVAAGAELDLGTILLLNVLDDLANNCPRCSALAVAPERSATGAVLMGRNLDYPLFTDILVHHQILFCLAPLRGLPLASVAWPGYVGVCTGLNRSGVALSQLTAMSRAATFSGVPAALRFRQALESGATLSQVAGHILSHPATIGNNLLLASGRDSLVLELSPRRSVTRQPAGGLLTVTNHFQCPEMTALKGRFPRRPPFAVLSPYHFTEAYSQARDRRLQELAGNRTLAPVDFQDILADSHLANPGTVISTVFAPATLTLWLAKGQTPPVNREPFLEVRPWD